MPNQDHRSPRRGAPSSRREHEGGSERQPPRHVGGMTMRQGVYRLPDDVARRVRLGHPWVFRDALGARKVSVAGGTLVDLVSTSGAFLARGYADEEHAIAIRIMSRDANERIHPGSGAVAKRFGRAVKLRWEVLGAHRPTALRLFSGENEGLPGVTVDRYGEFVVVQWLSSGALAWRDELMEAITSTVSPRGIYEQKRVRSLGGQAAPEPAVKVAGEEAPLEIVVEEGGCRFGVDVTAPLGVGFFPDMRLGRDAVARRAADRRVLNLFSYTGAFSVRAAKSGASEIVSVDTSAKVHARARRNFELSDLDPNRNELITADAMKTLERFADRGRSFDIVVCDPPTFSHGPGKPFSATSDLGQLAAAAAAVLVPGGLLAFATNAAKLSPAEVDRALAEGASSTGHELRIIERHALPADFPVNPGFPEGNYLKFVLAVKV
jgi:23S rRNA (cytosine1962-C5)-methyltransferase